MRTKVLIKHKNDLHWEDPQVRAYPDEAKLKTILRDDPALFPFDAARRPVVMVEEFPASIGASTGFVDLVGVSATGAITIVECKLEKNPEIKRTLIGQLIEYAAALWGLSFEEFDDLWQAVVKPGWLTSDQWEERKRPPLEEHIASAIEGDSAFDRGDFRLAVADNLRAGRFTLVVAVDSITEALERSILYLSEHTGLDARVVAMELGYVAHGDVEVLVPRTFGLEVAERKQPPGPTPAASRAWDEASFDAALLAKSEAALSVATDLRMWAVQPEIGLAVWYGHGATYGTAHLGLEDKAGKRHAVLSLSTSAGADLNFNDLRAFPAYAEHEARLGVLRALEPIEGGKVRKDAQADAWAQIDLARLYEHENLTAFEALLTDIVMRIRTG